MIVFAMDTTSQNAAVALMNNEKLMGEYMISNLKTHSQLIMPMMSDLIKNTGLTVDDVDVFSVCTGPGSFTGVRIGMTAIRTICQAAKKPIVGITSLKSLSLNVTADSDTVVCPIIDARHNEVYNALYCANEQISDCRMIDIDKLLGELEGKKVLFLGDGVNAYNLKINRPEWKIAPKHLCMQKASSVAYAAFERAQKNDFDNLYSLVPMYLRKSQAEREYELKHSDTLNS